eukprot:8638033-Pyramimonas_sp.AAC.1
MQTDIGIATNSRKKQVDTWIADHAREMKATWTVLRVDRHRLLIPGTAVEDIYGGQCAVTRLATEF